MSEVVELPGLSLFMSCISSLCLKDPRHQAGHTFHER
jgi:hypothetical protein